MNRKLLLLSAICAFALTACGVRGAASNSEAGKETASSSSSAETDSEGTSAPDKESAASGTGTSSGTDGAAVEVSLASLVELLGKNDSEAVALLGEGTPEYNGDDVLLSRTYTAELLGAQADLSLSVNLYQYGENLVEQCRADLSSGDLETYRAQLAELFGEPTESYDSSYFFQSGTVTIVLADPYGDGPYIEISIPSDQA